MTDAPAPKPGTVAARRAAAAAGRSTGPSAPPRTRRPAPRPSKPDPDRAPTTTSAPLDGERDERTTFLLESLRDLEREHAAGDIDDADYQALRDDYTARAAAALRAEQRGKAPPTPVKRRRSPAQWALIIAGIVGFAVLSGVLVARAVGERGAGEGVTGEVTLSPTQAAQDCIGLTAQVQQGTGDASVQEALECYQGVLEDDPDNAAAHTYLGWTLYITAVQASDDFSDEELADIFVRVHRELDLAVAADPRYADARAFQTILAAREERWDEAAEHLAAFDDLDAPADMSLLVEDVRQQIDDNT